MFICCCGVKTGRNYSVQEKLRWSFCLSVFLSFLLFFLGMSYLPLSLKFNRSVQKEGGGEIGQCRKKDADVLEY